MAHGAGEGEVGEGEVGAGAEIAGGGAGGAGVGAELMSGPCSKQIALSTK